MSLVTYPDLNSSGAIRAESEKSGKQSRFGAAMTIPRRLRSALAASGRLIVNIYEVIGEARLQKAIIEAELYRNRYRHTSRNDDDLPIVR